MLILLFVLILSIDSTWLRTKQGIICISTKHLGSYDVTSVWLVLWQLHVSSRGRHLFETRFLFETRHFLEHRPWNPAFIHDPAFVRSLTVLIAVFAA